MIDERKLVTDRAAEILRHWNRPIVLEMTVNQAIGLIGVVQLALRHPAFAKSPLAQMTREMILALIRHIDPGQGDVYKLLMMGFDPTYDVSTFDAPETGTPRVASADRGASKTNP